MDVEANQMRVAFMRHGGLDLDLDLDLEQPHSLIMKPSHRSSFSATTLAS